MNGVIIDAIDAELKTLDVLRTELRVKYEAAQHAHSVAFELFNDVDNRVQALRKARKDLGGGK